MTVENSDWGHAKIINWVPAEKLYVPKYQNWNNFQQEGLGMIL